MVDPVEYRPGASTVDLGLLAQGHCGQFVNLWYVFHKQAGTWNNIHGAAIVAAFTQIANLLNF